GPSGSFRGGKQHVPLLHTVQQRAQQGLPEPSAVVIGAHVDLGQLEVVGQPSVGGGLVLVVQYPATHLFVPPLAGTAPVAVGQAHQGVVRVECGHTAPARTEDVGEPHGGSLLRCAGGIVHGRHVDGQGVGQ